MVLGEPDDVQAACGEKGNADGVKGLLLLPHTFQQPQQEQGEGYVLHKIAVGTDRSLEDMMSAVSETDA